MGFLIGVTFRKGSKIGPLSKLEKIQKFRQLCSELEELHRTFCPKLSFEYRIVSTCRQFGVFLRPNPTKTTVISSKTPTEYLDYLLLSFLDHFLQGRSAVENSVVALFHYVILRKLSSLSYANFSSKSVLLT